MRMPFVLLFTAAILSGCTKTMDDQAEADASSRLSSAAYNAIADDMVRQLVEYLGKGREAIVLEADTAGFGQALSKALASWGYAVVTGQKTDEKQTHIRLVSVIDEFGGQSLASLSAGDLQLSRAYKTTTTGASSTSATSVTQCLQTGQDI